MSDPDEHLLFILAVDHRDSLERQLYGLQAPPTPVQAARISADKLLVYQALLDAAPQIQVDVQPGILVDEQYGATVAELAARSAGAISLSMPGPVALAMPIEASGKEWFELAYGEDWQHHAEFFATDYAKVLVRDNPGLDPAEREQQAARLAQVSRWAASARPLLLELLVPASPADLSAAGGDASRYDRELRGRLTIEVMEYLQDHGVEPAIWKVEGFEQPEDAAAVVATARRGGRNARCVMLGRHAEHDLLDRWLEVAATTPGYVGFAIGRNIWWDPLHAHLRHRCTAAEARRRITGAYLDFVNYFLSARDGTLDDPTAPEPW